MTCAEIEKCYEKKFLEIGSDENYIHFLVQSVPMHSVTKLVIMIKSLTAREVFKKCSHVKKQLWGGEFVGTLSCERVLPVLRFSIRASDVRLE